MVELVNVEDVAKTPGAVDLDSLKILQWVKQEFPDRPSMPPLVDVFIRTLIGADIREAGILYFAHYFACGGGVAAMLGEGKDSAQYQRLYDGTSS